MGISYLFTVHFQISGNSFIFVSYNKVLDSGKRDNSRSLSIPFQQTLFLV